MSFLQALGTAGRVVGAGFGGYAQDEQQRKVNALTQHKQDEEDQNSAVMRLVNLHKAAELQLGDANYASALAAVTKAQEIAREGVHVQEAKDLAPIHTQEAIDTAKGTAPITLGTHTAERDYDNAHPAPQTISTPNGVVRVPGNGPAVPILDAGGHPVVKGAIGGGGLAAPVMAKVGQAGEMLKKAADLLPLAEGLGVSLPQSASADIAHRGLGVGSLRIPGTSGVGSLMLNHDAKYAQYQAALSPFILAAAHALSGARINQDQVEQIRQSIEVAPGDLQNPAVIAQKKKNLIDLLNSITGSLPEDAISAQENQMDASSLQRLAGSGYRSRTGRGGASPAGASSGDPDFDALMAKYKKP